jgi:hypothetical protein
MCTLGAKQGEKGLGDERGPAKEHLKRKFFETALKMLNIFSARSLIFYADKNFLCSSAVILLRIWITQK